jgi:hypothetical protein
MEYFKEDRGKRKRRKRRRGKRRVLFILMF